MKGARSYDDIHTLAKKRRPSMLASRGTGWCVASSAPQRRPGRCPARYAPPVASLPRRHVAETGSGGQSVERRQTRLQTRRDATQAAITTRCAVLESAAASDGPPVDLGSVVVIDNYDSFTYNLSQYMGELGCKHKVIYNDTKSVSEIKKMKPRGILISPGPGRPEDSGVSMDVVKELGPEIPIMGVCMGLQCMAQVFGGVIIRSPYGVMHGRSSMVHHVGEGLLKGIPNPFEAARYHSLVVEKSSCPEELEITAWTDDGTIMGVRHKEWRHLQAVQFHPESILTDYGKQIVQNFIDMLEE